MRCYSPHAHPIPHLTARAFHQRLLHPPPHHILLDVRNAYEVSIGHFPSAQHPHIRSFAQFAVWTQQNAGALQGKAVTMYCTGGGAV